MLRPDINLVLMSFAFVILVIAVVFVEYVSANKCYRNEAIGDRDGNVYYCAESALPRCCVEQETPTCCKSEAAKNLEEQLQLWGTVAAMIAVVAIVFVCCKNDVACCTSETSLKDRWNNFRGKNKAEHLKEEEVVEKSKGDYFDNPATLGYPGENYPPKSFDPYNFPPLPPISPGPSGRASYA